MCSFRRLSLCTHTGVARILVGGGHPADATQPCISRAQVEAVASSWEAVSAPAVNRVMGGAPERNKNSKQILVK